MTEFVRDVIKEVQTNKQNVYEKISEDLKPLTEKLIKRQRRSVNREKMFQNKLSHILSIFYSVLKYVHKNNEYGEGTLLNRANFSTLLPFLYFDLTKQKMDIKDGTTKLTFKCELSGTTATAYFVYALTPYEQDVELIQKDGKILLRS